MSFTVHGTYYGLEVSLTWDAGELSSDDPSALQALAQRIDAGELVPVTPTGPFLEPDRADGWTVYCLAFELLGDPVTEGPVPACPVEVESVPGRIY